MSIDLQSSKVEVLLSTLASVATNTTNYGYIDTLGWDYAKVIATVGTAASTSDAFKTIYLTEGTNSTAATAIVAFTGTTGSVTTSASGFVIPNFSTSEPTAVVLNVDLRKRERYLRVNTAPGTAAAVSVVALLTRGREAMPSSDTGSPGVTKTG